MWNCYQVNASAPHWSLVNIGSGNGLVPSGNKFIIIRQAGVKRQSDTTDVTMRRLRDFVKSGGNTPLRSWNQGLTLSSVLYTRFVVTCLLPPGYLPHRTSQSVLTLLRGCEGAVCQSLWGNHWHDIQLSWATFLDYSRGDAANHGVKYQDCIIHGCNIFNVMGTRHDR